MPLGVLGSEKKRNLNQTFRFFALLSERSPAATVGVSATGIAGAGTGHAFAAAVGELLAAPLPPPHL